MMGDDPPTKRARHIRRAGQSSKPPLPEFTKDQDLNQLVPAPTIMRFYHQVVEAAYRAEMMCEAENKVSCIELTPYIW